MVVNDQKEFQFVFFFQFFVSNCFKIVLISNCFKKPLVFFSKVFLIFHKKEDFVKIINDRIFCPENLVHAEMQAMQ